MKQVSKRDSQTLLRKNSLFLVNCLTTRYRDRDTLDAHIGEVTQAANQKRLTHFTEKAQSVTHYQQRFEYMEEAKQRLLQAKVVRAESHKETRLSPLLPEPWEENQEGLLVEK